MLVEATLDARCPASQLFDWIADLGRYPAWLDLVRSASPAASGPDGQPAWDVVLSAKVGPLRRSKRLRMVRTVLESAARGPATPGHDDAGATTGEGGTVPLRARFERRELDGRDHAAWVLDALVHDAPDATSRLEMTLRYDGRLWGPLLEPVLAEQIAAGRRNLASLVVRPA